MTKYMVKYMVTMVSSDGCIVMRVGVRTYISGMARIYALVEWFQRFKDIPTTTLSVDEENSHAG